MTQAMLSDSDEDEDDEEDDLMEKERLPRTASVTTTPKNKKTLNNW